MFTFAFALIFLPPMSLQSPNQPAAIPASPTWHVHEGFIVDSQGKRIGVFGVDAARSGLVR